MTKCVYFRYMNCKTILELINNMSPEEAYKTLPKYCPACPSRKTKARASGMEY